jgi:Ca2+-binding RTX toxin-like protein
MKNLNSLLATVLTATENSLNQFAQNNDFLSELQLAYGDNFNKTTALNFAQAWQNNDFSIVPTIEFLSATELNGANGAYSQATDTIYLSQPFFSQNQDNLSVLTNLLLEEIGHRLDTLLNTADSAGDEGAIFAEILRGGVESLFQQALQALKAENDAGTITVNGEVIAVEMQNFVGTAGDDVINGTNASDNIQGLAGSDIIRGLEGDDTIDGGDGNDNISTGTGNDTVNGGAGVDRILIDRQNAILNVIINSSSFQQVEYIDARTGSGNDTIDVSSALISTYVQAGAGDDTITGSSGNDEIYTGTGNDTVNGGAGFDYVYLFRDSQTSNITINSSSFQQIEYIDARTGSGNDTIDLSSVGYAVIRAGAGDDSIIGSSGNDTIYTEAGKDTVNGGAGDDSIYGGNPFVNSVVTGDSLTGGAGFDRVFITTPSTGFNLTYTNVNNGTFTDGGIIKEIEGLYVQGGSGDDNINAPAASYVSLLGFDGNDTLTGGIGNDNLDGGNGNDILNGGAGDDNISTGTGNDTVNGGAGVDRILIDRQNAILNIVISSSSLQQVEVINAKTGSGNDTIDVSSALISTQVEAGAGDDTITGSSGNDVITMGAGNDIVNAGAGIDTLFGGTGNDAYTIDNTSDSITEYVGEGTDNVQSSVTYTLSANIENLTLTGTSNINGTGNAINNILTGNTGNNILDGGLGIDSLIGSTGDDTYVIDNLGDTFTENVGEGTDTIQTNLTYSIANLLNLENLTLTGTTNINATGNTNNNILTGNAGINILSGGAGNDTYVVDNSGDTVTENTGEGTQDTIKSSITFSLAALTQVENLTLTGNGVIDGTGNTKNNKLTGNAQNNNLNGANGTDKIDGGIGKDILTGGGGNDTLVFRFGESTISNADSIVDFTIANDKIDILTQSGTVTGAPTSFSRASNSAAVTLTNVVNNVFTDSDGLTAGNQALGVNDAALVVVTTAGIAGTYLVINDAVAGFQSAVDTVVNITGYSGALPSFGTIPVNNFFV